VHPVSASQNTTAVAVGRGGSGLTRRRHGGTPGQNFKSWPSVALRTVVTHAREVQSAMQKKRGLKRDKFILSKRNGFVQEKGRRKEFEIFLSSSISNKSSCSCYLAELAFPAYAYIDGHRLLPALPILGRRHHSAAISPRRLQIMLHQISDTII
jgi:hypothetical protein